MFRAVTYNKVGFFDVYIYIYNGINKTNKTKIMEEVCELGPKNLQNNFRVEDMFRIVFRCFPV